MRTCISTSIRSQNLTQREVARRAGLDETVLSKAISGRLNLRLDEKLRLAAVLNKPVEELFRD